MPTPESPILDALARAVPIAPRRMFGCVGAYSEGAFFAIMDGDRLYFKVDETTLPSYEGMAPFQPPKGHSSRTYYEVPDHVLDDPIALREWAEAAIAVARNSKAS